MTAEPSEWQNILAEFLQVSQPFTVASTPRHGVEHQVITTGRPAIANPLPRPGTSSGSQGRV
jgi:hypothetical protein